MKNKETTKQLVISAVIVSLALLFGIAMVNQSNKVSESERLEELRQSAKDSYLFCANSAYIKYSGDWDNDCLVLGEEVDCVLPTYRADVFDERLEKDNQTCLEIYELEINNIK